MNKSILKTLTCFILLLAVITGVMSGCKKKPQDATDVTLPAGQGDAVLQTDENGDIARNENNQAVAVVTDANGYAVTEESGEVKTEAVPLTHALVLDDKVETATFSVGIPKGWMGDHSYEYIVIDSTDKNETDKIVIYTRLLDDTEHDDGQPPMHDLFNLIKSGVTVNKEKKDDIKIAGVDATRERCDVTSEKIETRVLSFYSFTGKTATYGVICYSKDAKTADKTFEDVLNTIEFY